MESSARNPKSSESQPITSAPSRPSRKPRQKKQTDSQPTPDASSSRRHPGRRLSPSGGGSNNNTRPSPSYHPFTSIHPMTFSPSIPKHCGARPRLPVCCRTRSHSTAISWRALYDESQLSRQPFSLRPASLYLHLPRNTRHERHQQSCHPRPILPHAHRVSPSPARIRSISPISAADDDVRPSPPEYVTSRTATATATNTATTHRQRAVPCPNPRDNSDRQAETKNRRSAAEGQRIRSRGSFQRKCPKAHPTHT